MPEQKLSSGTSQTPNWRNILLIRHGATALNSDDHTVDRIRGWSDWPLSDQGKEEAKKLAFLDGIPDILLTSDLIRAQQTAVIIANTLDIEMALPPTEDFRPWNVGDFVGRSAAEVVPLLAQYATQKPMLAVPGGESFLAFHDRFFLGLLRALQCYPGLIGIVTHHRCERLLKAWAKASYPENGFIDLDEFTCKGETTGHCEIIGIPVHRLELWYETYCWYRGAV